MRDWLRPLAPLGYVVGAVFLIDPLAYVISHVPYHLGGDADRLRFATLVASRLSELTIGFLLLGASAILAGHRRFITTWLILVGVVALVALATVPLAATASPERLLAVPEQRSADYLAAAKAVRLRLMMAGLAGAVALTTLAVAVRGLAAPGAETEPQ